ELRVHPPLLVALTITSAPQKSELLACWLPRKVLDLRQPSAFPRRNASVDTGSILTDKIQDDFPRYHPCISARDHSGFTDISQYGLVSTHPTRNFATLGIIVTQLIES